MELNGQLSHMFFDEGHVAFTDRSYRTKLRDLWKLRYLDCPFTVLTATLMPKLEGKLREQLLIPDAVLFRRSTVRPRIQYRVVDSNDEVPLEVGVSFIRGLGPLPQGKKGVIYVRSYATGEKISHELDCPFYKATAEQKSELLQEWTEGSGGWIVATGALGTGINIRGIIYVIHIDRPYGLTSFAQQSGRGGRDGDVSQSIVIVRAKTTRPYKRSGIISEYSTEQVDEEAMTAYIQSKGCRRLVLGEYFDGEIMGEVNCRVMDYAFCDFCSVQSQQERVLQALEEEEQDTDAQGVAGEAEGIRESSGSQRIQQRLYEVAEADEQMFKVMGVLREGCIYCGLIQGQEGAAHRYASCTEAKEEQCDIREFRQWRRKVDLATGQDCYKCGLSQRLCTWREDGRKCEYAEVIIPGMFILDRSSRLQTAAEIEGFQGNYEADIWEWMREMDEGVQSEVESNWMKTWRQVCNIYSIIRGR
jgi:superfamily II DNA helicase RecQ